jgi:glyoxylase-like metal-dependent hydrolase (beta-lactamase superfamily II)
MTRREFIASAAGTTAAVLLASRVGAGQRSEDMYFEWKPVCEGARAAFGNGGNALVVVGVGGVGVGKQGAMLVDCKNAPFGQELRREAETGTKLTHVVNTHHHRDHTGGNHAFTPDLPVIAQVNAAPRILNLMKGYVAQINDGLGVGAQKQGLAAKQVQEDRKALHARVAELKATEFAPTITFEKDYEIDLGGTRVNLHHYGPGHTDNDLIVHIPSLNVLHMGDLVFNKMHPVVDMKSGASTRGWQESLRKAIALCDDKTHVVPGHGELCGIEALKAQLEYFDTMRDLVSKELKAGKSRKDVVEIKLPATLYPDYAKPDFVADVLGAIFDELKAGEK